MRRTQHSKPAYLSTIQKFPCNYTCFDRFTDARVIGDQDPDRIEAQRQQQGHELIGPRFTRNASERTKRAGARTKAQPNGISEQASRTVVADVCWIRCCKQCGLYLFKAKMNAGDFFISAA